MNNSGDQEIGGSMASFCDLSRESSSDVHRDTASSVEDAFALMGKWGDGNRELTLQDLARADLSSSPV